MKALLFKYWKPFSLPLTIILGVLSFLWVQHRHAGELEQARTEVAVANHQADQAIDVMQAAISYAQTADSIADAVVARAEAAEARRKAQAPAVATIVAQAPDTCAPVIAALEGARELAIETADAWKQAYDTTLAANARLQAAAGPLVDASKGQTEASEHLSDVSRPSFFQRILPKVGVGVTTGIDPIDRSFHVVVGPSAHWSF